MRKRITGKVRTLIHWFGNVTFNAVDSFLSGYDVVDFVA